MGWRRLGGVLTAVVGMILALPLVTANGAAPAIDRIGGIDRYATSAHIAAAGFPGTANRVVLASGEDFPDALVAGTAAGANGVPVLLTRRGEVPQAIRTVLDRFDPAELVVLGQEAAVSAAVADELRTWGTVTRLGGANRYATAVQAATWAFESPSVVYLASGADFPDALSGGSVAARSDGPLLLTDPQRLSPETGEYLSTLDLDQIILLGGPTAVSAAVARAAAEIAPVSRIAGTDRYGTSAAVSRSSLVAAHTVFLASGDAFPDALSATPWAATLPASVLLVGADRVSPSVCDEVRRLEPTRVIALGGSSAVSDDVWRQVVSECVGSLLPLPRPTNTTGPTPQGSQS